MSRCRCRGLVLFIIVFALNNNIFFFTFFTEALDLAHHTSLARKNCSIRMSEANNMQFGKFIIPSSHIFYRTSLSAAFVNLRPIVPGHVLVIPERVTPYLADLTDEEYHDLWSSVRVVQRILQQHHVATTAFNVAVQDGRAAGQSVPHVHIHILPRADHDLERNDDIYDRLGEWAPRPEMAQTKSSKLEVADDANRKDRTTEQMAEEAAVYRSFIS